MLSNSTAFYNNKKSDRILKYFTEIFVRFFEFINLIPIERKCERNLQITDQMPESVVPIFRALGPLETYLSELYTHNFGTIGCAIWVDTDVSQSTSFFFSLTTLFIAFPTDQDH